MAKRVQMITKDPASAFSTEDGHLLSYSTRKHIPVELYSTAQRQVIFDSYVTEDFGDLYFIYQFVEFFRQTGDERWVRSLSLFKVKELSSTGKTLLDKCVHRPSLDRAEFNELRLFLQIAFPDGLTKFYRSWEAFRKSQLG